ncbi:flavin monoamine oxidase family protein [Mucilaginibacter sp.]
METTEIIVIGAGAAGLMAASTLAKAGKQVMVLEGRNRTGGRIHTLTRHNFFKSAELGAEFVHGDLPLSLRLINEAGLKVEHAGCEMWQYKAGQFSQSEMEDDHWDAMLQKMNGLTEDLPLNAFLNQYFSGNEYDSLRASVLRYVAGYDTGDPDKASTFALREEWQQEDEGAQHRITGGYCSLINHLANQCNESGARIYLNETVKTINWQPQNVNIITATGEQFAARRLLVAVPLGVLQRPGSEAALQFEPALQEQEQAWQQMGFGDVIKVLLQFDTTFWEEDAFKGAQGKGLQQMAFLFSQEQVPTWWTQQPNHQPLLTGWLAGAYATRLKHLTNEELLEQALQSLAHVFKYDLVILKAKLIAGQVANWSADSFTCGSYAYDTVAAPAARKLLNAGVADTIFFAGDYLYGGPAMGTVEAALQSGLQTAQTILSHI